MKTYKLETVRELREWLEANAVSFDAKIEVWNSDTRPGTDWAPRVELHGVSKVVIRAD